MTLRYAQWTGTPQGFTYRNSLNEKWEKLYEQSQKT